MENQNKIVESILAKEKAKGATKPEDIKPMQGMSIAEKIVAKEQGAQQQLSDLAARIGANAEAMQGALAHRDYEKTKANTAKMLDESSLGTKPYASSEDVQREQVQTFMDKKAEEARARGMKDYLDSTIGAWNDGKVGKVGQELIEAESKPVVDIMTLTTPYNGEKINVADMSFAGLPNTAKAEASKIVKDYLAENPHMEANKELLEGYVANNIYNDAFKWKLENDEKFFADAFEATHGIKYKDFLRERVGEIKGIIKDLRDEAGAVARKEAKDRAINDLLEGGQDLRVPALEGAMGKRLAEKPYDEMLDKLNDWEKNNFASGFATGFDWADFFSLGLADMLSTAEMSNVLEKANRGEELYGNETRLYELAKLTQELESYRDKVYESQGLMSKIGGGIGTTVEMLPEFAMAMTGTGAIGSFAKLGGKAALKSALKAGGKELFKYGVKTTGKLGYNYGLAKVRGLAAAPFMPSTYNTYLDTLNSAYSFDDDGNLTYTPVDNTQSYFGAVFSTANEVSSEYLGIGIGKVVGLGARGLGRMVAGTKLAEAAVDAGKKVRKYLPKLTPQAKVAMRTLGVQADPVSETLSEALGDIMTSYEQTWLGMDVDKSQYGTMDYWMTLAGVTLVYGGSMAAMGAVKSYNDVRKAVKERDAILGRITDRSLHDALVAISASDDVVMASSALADMNWEAFGDDADLARAYIAADLNVKVMEGAVEEESRLGRFRGTIEGVRDIVYQGKAGEYSGIIREAEVDGKKVYVINGYEGETGQYVVVDAATGEKSTVDANKATPTRELDVDTYIQEAYTNAFSLESEKSRVKDVREKALQMGNPTEKDVQRVASTLDIALPKVGDAVMLANGNMGSVTERLSPIEYAVQDLSGATYKVHFTDILSTDKLTATAQGAMARGEVSTPISTTEASAVETSAEDVTPNVAEPTVDENGITMGSEVTIDGRVGTVRARTENGDYVVAFEDESGNYENAEVEVYTPAEMASLMGVAPMPSATTESTTEGTPTTTEVATTEDGRVDIEQMSAEDAAKVLVERAGTIEEAIAQVKQVIETVTEERKKMAKEEKKASLNDVGKKSAELQALDTRLEFYGEVLGVLEAMLAEQQKQTMKEARNIAEEAGVAPTTTEETTNGGDEKSAEIPTSGLIRNGAEMKFTDNVIKMVDFIAKRLGIVVEFVDGLKNEAGQPINGDITGKHVRISTSGTRGVKFIMGHEFFHRMKDLVDEQTYVDFVNSIKAYAGEKVWNATMARQRNTYRNHNARVAKDAMKDMGIDEVAKIAELLNINIEGMTLEDAKTAVATGAAMGKEQGVAEVETIFPTMLSYSDELMVEECAADVAGTLVTNTNRFAKYVEDNSSNNALVRGLRKVIRAMSEFFDSFGYTDQQRKLNALDKMLERTLNEAVKNEREGVKKAREDAKKNGVQGSEARFSLSSTPIFFSNAQYAVQNIKQEKATPEQWLKMIEKNGGLKAGEDKWLGLSDWLKASDKKTLSKEDVLQYIAENDIQIEEVSYGDVADISREEIYESAEFAELREGLTEYDEDDNPHINRERYDELRSESYDFVDGFTLDYWGEELEVDSPAAAATYLGLTKADKEINETRLGYTTQGLNNKREIALVAPTIEPYNKSDEIHFGDAGEGRAVAWIRFGETETPKSIPMHQRVDAFDAPFKNVAGYDVYAPEGRGGKFSKDYVIYGKLKDGSEAYIAYIGTKPISKHETLEEARNAMNEYYAANPHMITRYDKVLVIDEIQSKRHQDGREKGYSDKRISQQELYDAQEAAFEAVMEQERALADKYGEDEWASLASAEEMTEYERLRALDEAATNAYENYDKGVPSAPFEKNWAELAFKRMLRYAAENGYDYVAWTTGDQQADRYDIGSVVKDIVAYDTKDADGNPIKKMKFRMNNMGTYNIATNMEGVIVKGDGEMKEGMHLSDITGKPLAEKIMKGEGEDAMVFENGKDIEAKSLEGEELHIGNEGMKAFYDQMLPSFVKKYTKKWGAEVGEVTMPDLEENNTMHAVNVTDSMRESVMQGQPKFSLPSLVGVHNLSLDKLRKVIKMGGLANPSVAVIDVDKQTHEDYGEYSLILPKNMVDARQGKNAGTWAGDAWTPTYPQVVKRMNDDKAISRFYKDIDALPEAMRSRVRLDFDSFMDGRSANALAYWYLFEKGNAPEMVLVPSRYSNDVTNAVSEATKGSFSMFNLTPEERAKCLDAYIAVKFDGDRAAFEAEMQARIERLAETIETKKSDRVKKWAQDTIDSIKEYGFDYNDVAEFIRDVEYDAHEKGKVNVDATITAARERIKANDLEADYDTWRNNLDERYGIEEYIFDGYTNSGNRRYLPHTVENASKWMKKQGRQGAVATFPSFGTFVAVSIPKMTTLESIRKRKALLGKSKEEYDAFREKWENVYYELGKKLQPDAKSFEDYGYWRLIEAVGQKNPKEFIKKEYGIELSEEDMAQLNAMLDAIRTEYPARYFETKFERPLQLSDFTAAVVPNDIPLDVESRLKDANVEVIEYEKGDNASRAEAMQKASAMENVRFSLQETNDRFNSQLATLTEENARERILDLGRPSSILLSTGIEDKPIRLYGAKLLSKLRKHGYDISALKNLPLAINLPIAVFEGSHEGSFAILTELKIKDNNVLAALSVGKGGHDIDFNIISSVYDKRGDSVARWVIDGKMLYADKKKALDYFSVSAPIAEAQNNQELISVTNIIQNFENPKIEARNSLITPEMDASYLDAVERGDMATAQKMVMETAKLAMPNTKVVDEDGNPKVVYHGTPNNFNAFSKEMFGKSTDRGIWGNGFYFSDSEQYAKTYEKRGDKQGKTLSVFLNIKRPLFISLRNGGNEGAMYFHELMEKHFTDDIYEDVTRTDELMSVAQERLTADIVANGYDGIVVEYTNHIDTEYVAFEPNQIKSADPVTYDDNGNVIPLSERFNPEKEDIRYSLPYNGDVARVFEDAGKIAKSYHIPQNIIVAGSLQDYKTALLSYGVPAEKIILETSAVYLDWEDIIVVNAVNIFNPEHHVSVLAHENMHAITRREKDKVETIAKKLPITQILMFAENELGYPLDYIKNNLNGVSFTVVDEIISTFVEQIAAMPVTNWGYVLRRYLTGSLTIDEVLEACELGIVDRYKGEYKKLTDAAKDLLRENLIKLRDEQYKAEKVGNTIYWGEGGTSNRGGNTVVEKIDEDFRKQSQAVHGGARIERESGSEGADAQEVTRFMLPDPDPSDIFYDEIPIFDEQGNEIDFNTLNPEEAKAILDSKVRQMLEAEYEHNISAIRKEAREARQAIIDRYNEEKGKRKKNNKPSRTNAARIDDILGDKPFESLPLEDQALILIATGRAKIRWGDNGTQRGLASELGLTGYKGDKHAYRSIWSGATKSFSEVVHDWWESIGGQERGIDDQDLRNALIEAFQSVQSSKDAMGEIMRKYDDLSAERDASLAEVDRMEEKDLREAKSAYDQHFITFELSVGEERAAYHDRAAQFFGNQNLSRTDEILEDLVSEMERQKRKIERLKAENKDVYAPLAEGIQKSKDIILHALERLRMFAGMETVDLNDVARLVDLVKAARSQRQVENLGAQATALVQRISIKKAKANLYRLLSLKLSNTDVIHKMLAESDKWTKEERDAILKHLWKVSRNGLRVSKAVHRDTKEIFDELKRLVYEFRKEKLKGLDNEQKALAIDAKLAKLEQELHPEVVYDSEGNVQDNSNLPTDFNADNKHLAKTLFKTYLKMLAAEAKYRNASKVLREKVENKEQTGNAYADVVATREDYLQALKQLNSTLEDLILKGKNDLRDWNAQKEKREIEIRKMGIEAIGGEKADSQGKRSKWGARQRARLNTSVNAPYWTFETVLEKIDHKTPYKRGKFYTYFMDKWSDANDDLIMRYMAHFEQLGEAMSKCFPNDATFLKMKRNPYRMFQYIMRKAESTPIGTITYKEGDSERQMVLNVANAMYIIAMWRQPRYQEAMKERGITQKDVDTLMQSIKTKDAGFIDFMNWVNEKFLPSTRLEYDVVFRKMNGGSMPKEVNYFPARVAAHQEVDLANIENGAMPTTPTALKDRTSHHLMPEMGMDYFKVLEAHIEDMDKWAAYAELTADLNVLLSSDEFRRRLNEYMGGLGGDGGGKGSLYELFKQTSLIATGLYRGDAGMQAFLGQLQKTWATSNIAFRGWTALKQISSVTTGMFDNLRFYKHALKAASIVGIYPEIKDAMAVSPSLRQRWKSGAAGMEALAREAQRADGYTVQRGAYEKSKDAIGDAIKLLVRAGMTPNAAVDLLSCSIIVNSVYETEIARLTGGKREATEDEKRAAVRKAERAFNTTQQSSEGAYLAPVQANPAFGVLTTYMNASFALHRKRMAGVKELWKLMTSKEYRRFIKDEYGVGAGKMSAVDAFKDILSGVAGELSFAAMGWGLMELMSWVNSWLNDDDDDDDTAAAKEEFMGTWWMSFLNGYLGGSLATSIMQGFDTSLTPAYDEFISDVKGIFDDKGDAVNEAAQVATKYGLGVDLKSLYKIGVGVKNLFEDDERTGAILMLINAPERYVKAFVGDRREGETMEEYQTRIVRYYTLFGDVKHSDYFDENGNPIGKDAPSIIMSKTKVGALRKEYEVAYRKDVLYLYGGKEAYASYMDTEKKYKDICELLGWKAESKPSKEKSKLSDMHKELAYEQKQVAKKAEKRKNWIGSEEDYYDKLMDEQKAKDELINQYYEYIKQSGLGAY